MAKYVLSVDQSTQGTKALIFDEAGKMLARADLPHRQIINDAGWVSHDPEEIYQNTLKVVRLAAEKAGIDPNHIACMGISNQRETTVAWDKNTGKPVCDAIVWQCARAATICERLEGQGLASAVQEKTGLRLSPYFSAAKLTWILENVPGAAELYRQGKLCVGTMDAWLVYKLTGRRRFQTDYSNASRTQLFNIRTLQWDGGLLDAFGVDLACMPRVTDSDGDFGETDFEGWLRQPIPIRGVLGDSHAALLGQGCVRIGMTKATYGTGSSIMMNIGDQPAAAAGGVVTSLAWKLGGQVQYVLEGNINYTGAVITWLKDDVQLISDPGETESLARAANPADACYLVPAFSGLGAPYWNSKARAVLCSMIRTTGKKEIVRAALDSIAYQITDIIRAMGQSADMPLRELRADGGPTRNGYLMQFQSDLLNIPVCVPEAVELSGIGAAYAAGIATGVYGKTVLDQMEGTTFYPQMDAVERGKKYAGWLDAVRRINQD